MAARRGKRREVDARVKLSGNSLILMCGEDASYSIIVDGAKISSLRVPAGFAFRILNRERDALMFLRGVMEAPILSRFKEDLLRKYMMSKRRAWRLLEEYVRSNPSGKPFFYRSEQSLLDLTDGEVCFSFWYPSKVDLPLNVYCNATWPKIVFDMNPERLAVAQSRISDFFEFMKRLCRLIERAPPHEVNDAFSRYFEDADGAWKMLGAIEDLVRVREEMEECLHALQMMGVIMCDAGYFVWHNGVFYVTGDGRVYLVGGAFENGKRVLRDAIKRGIKPNSMDLIEERRPEILRIIAQKIGRINPSLAVVILP